MSNPAIKNFSDTAIIPTSISPWLPVSNGEKAVAFYKSAFGAIEVYRLEVPGGGLVARLSVDGAEFWLSGESSSQDENLSLVSPVGSPIRMILTVSDPDALFDKALKAGASEVFAVGEEHGWRLGRLADPFGHQWEIGRPLIN